LISTSQTTLTKIQKHRHISKDNHAIQHLSNT